MKRIVGLVLAGLMCLGLCACGNDAKEASSGTSEPSEVASPAGEISVEAEDVTPEDSEDLIENVNIDELDVIQTPDYPSFEPSELDQEEKLEELTYKASKKWQKQEKDEDGVKTVSYDSGDSTLFVTATPIDPDTEALIKDSQESNDWDGLLAIWTQNYTAPYTASWYDSMQVYVPGSRIAWEVNATSDAMDIPAEEFEAEQAKTEITLTPSQKQCRGLTIVGDKFIYSISYSGIDLFLSGFTTDWNNIVASCKVGDGVDPEPLQASEAPVEAEEVNPDEMHTEDASSPEASTAAASSSASTASASAEQ